MNHNTISGKPHEEDIRKLVNNELEISAKDLRAITATNEAMTFYANEFFRKAMIAARMGVNWLYIFIPDETIMNKMKDYLEGLGYKVTMEESLNYGIIIKQMKISW